MARAIVSALKHPGARPKDPRRFARFLSQSVLLEESGPPHLMSLGALAVSGLVMAFVVWAALAPFGETSTAMGRISPSGTVRSVQHLEGGIVAEIFVKDGDAVDAGQKLLKLSPTSAEADRGQLGARAAELALRVERLRAFALERPALFEADPAYADLIQDQADILATQNVSRERQREVIRAQINERESALDSLSASVATAERHAELLEQELAMREELLEKGLVSKVVYIETMKGANAARGDVQSALAERRRAASALAEAKGRLLEMEADLRNGALAEMGRASAELASVNSEIAKLDDRARRTEIAAPVKGLVKSLAVASPGDVVAPGEILLEIVPVDETLLAEVRISPRDIGHIAVGDEALVKISTYDFARFGGLRGTVSYLAASSSVDEKGEAYFKAKIALPRDYVGGDPRSNRIAAGMEATADIKTGEKTLLQYLVRPVYTAMSNTFSER